MMKPSGKYYEYLLDKLFMWKHGRNKKYNKLHRVVAIAKIMKTNLVVTSDEFNILFEIASNFSELSLRAFVKLERDNLEEFKQLQSTIEQLDFLCLKGYEKIKYIIKEIDEITKTT